MPSIPLVREDHISQIPALQLLQNLGWTYLTQSEALALRSGRRSSVLLERVLEEQLRKINRISFKGDDHPFSEGNIHLAIQALKDMPYDGLVRTNEKVYDLLTLGKSLQQTIGGDSKSFTLKYIDWENPERNNYHVTEEFEVERAGRKDVYTPDLVLFVNGIPLGVIECKRIDLGLGSDPVEQAISQHIRNQKEDGIPKLYSYVQLLWAVSKNGAQYATTGTPLRFWSKWREDGNDEHELTQLINRPLSEEARTKLFGSRFSYVRDYFDAVEADGGRTVTEQDRMIWALCRPPRVLELTNRFMLYDAGEKKVARHQQYFCVKKIVRRISNVADGRRKGGLVWHTQGSGKSLTMVMLAKAIALAEGSYKIVLVTDRVDLDDQIFKTFKQCGIEPVQATTGSSLVDLLSTHKSKVITTVINKFDAAVGKPGVRNEDADIFVLVDEGHRTQYGTLHAKMRKVMPNACYIGFTGTPVMKKDKNTVDRFGGLIDRYTIKDAIGDGAVVPLLYEGRHIEQSVDSKAIDEWFDRVTRSLTDAQKEDLKKKFASAGMLFKAAPVVKAIAWDISEHFKANWKGTPFKGQLVTPDKATALLYKEYLDSFAVVRSEVLISGPDDREGEEDVYAETKDRVKRFWKVMMERYGTEREYNRQLIAGFKHADPEDQDERGPEILIVVDKLLTGFDSPNNVVLYLGRQLRDHTLLQAIARVNRLHDGKQYGFLIDYRGVLENLNQALDMYSALAEFDPEDLAGTISDMRGVYSQLPAVHSALWDIFKEVRNTRDEEAYERLLGDELVRGQFYERLSSYTSTLKVALSSEAFLRDTEGRKVGEYRRDVAFFAELKRAVQRRYAEVVSYGEYEARIKDLLDTHIRTGATSQIVGAVNLFNKSQRDQAVAESATQAAKADTIAHNLKRVISEKWDEDPVFYRTFSQLLEEAIGAFRAQRLRDAEYHQKVLDIEDAVINRTGDDVPAALQGRPGARPYYRVIKEVLQRRNTGADGLDALSADISLEVERIIEELQIVNWSGNTDVQNRMRQRIEDYIFDVKGKYTLNISFEELDAFMDQCLSIAKARRS
jgi:type I restriction enzyme, R subunit